MKYSNKTHSKSIGENYDLTKGEVRTLDLFLSYGRAWLSFSFLLSLFFVPWITIKCWGILYEHIYSLLIWFIFLTAAFCYSLPIVFSTLKCLLLSLFKKDKRPSLIVLGASFLGWDRYYQKAGTKPIHLDSPEDLFAEDLKCGKDAALKWVIKELDKFNDKDFVNCSLRQTCYRCIYDAMVEVKLIASVYINEGKGSLKAYSQFLNLLGSKYKLSESRLKMEPKVRVDTSDNFYTYNSYQEYLKDRICKELNISK